MSDTQKRLVELFDQVIPTMTEREKERLLDFGDGMAFMAWGRIAQQAQDQLAGVRDST